MDDVDVLSKVIGRRRLDRRPCPQCLLIANWLLVMHVLGMCISLSCADVLRACESDVSNRKAAKGTGASNWLSQTIGLTVL